MHIINIQYRIQILTYQCHIHDYCMEEFRP